MCFFAGNLGEDQKKRSSSKTEVFFLLNHYSRGIWCHIRPDFVSLFPLINQRLNLDGGRLNLNGGTLNLELGRSSSMGDASPPSPLQFKYCTYLPHAVEASHCPFNCWTSSWKAINRGGVEDTRLEAKAKAKDTKKIRGQGQGQPFRGQTLSRPRTGMLEAKAKDQGHKAQVLSKKKKKKKKKKKVFTKIFQAISTKKRFPKNFSTAPQNFNFPKNSAVLEPRTGQFSRTWGLEAKAKDLTFEAKAKAKDFKICPRGRPRGQGRPRGLHLWLLMPIFMVFGLTRPGIEPESTASVADALFTRRGAETRGEYIPPIIWLYPPIVWVWSTSAPPQIIWLWCASERRCPLEFAEKSVPFLVKPFFFLVFT